ncbi:MAG TPA: MaoC/PaaZ C-terminal domain-containing protein [Polyangia bacterium]
MTRAIASIHVGDALPPLEKPPITTTQLVQYAGASGDFNRIHYDEPFAKEGGFPSVIAHGMLSMAFFGQLVAGWAGGPEHVARLAARFKAVTFPGDRITVGGEVVARDEAARTVELKLFAKKADGTVTLEGTATVRVS